MPTKGSREQDAIVYRALEDSRAGEVEFVRNKVTPAGPHHYDRGQIGGGSKRDGWASPGAGRSGAADEKGA